MKKIICLLACVCASSALAKVDWKDGTERETQLAQNQEKARASFAFVNSGKTPLSIASVAASCGCTAPEYAKGQIDPGEEGSVTLEYIAKPPGFGRTVTAQVYFSDGESVGLTWRVVSSQSAAQSRPQIPLITWMDGDQSPKVVEIDLPEGHTLEEPTHPAEVRVTAKKVSDTRAEVTLERVSEKPFWGAIRIKTNPPLEDHRTRINVRASP